MHLLFKSKFYAVKRRSKANTISQDTFYNCNINVEKLISSGGGGYVAHSPLRSVTETISAFYRPWLWSL